MNYIKATIWDCMDIVRLWQKMVDEMPTLKKRNPKAEYFLIKVVNHFNKVHDIDKPTIILAKDKEKIVGFYYTYFVRDEYSDNLKGFGECNYVEPEYRNRGIQQNFMDMAMDEMKKYNVKIAEFMFEIKDGKSFYGFTPESTIYRKEI